VKELQGRASAELELAPGDCFELLTEPPFAITLTRVPNGRHDPDRLELIWRVGGAESTWLELEFDAAASCVPGFLPVGDAGDAIAQAAIEAARDALTR
jgi:hypothetical protein